MALRYQVVFTMKGKHSLRLLLFVGLSLITGCSSRESERPRSEAQEKGAGQQQSPAGQPSQVGQPSQAGGEAQDAWLSGTTEEAMLHNLRAHYREAAAAARIVKESASSEAVRTEAEWLIVIYDHVAEHFDTSLRDWYGPQAAQAPDPVLSEFTDPKSVSLPRERERRFAEEVSRNHARLLSYVRSPVYERFAANRPLLREIQVDVETSQAAQVSTFLKAVQGG